MAEFDTRLLGFVFTLWLHASVLLAAVWLAERVGLIVQAGWREIAWRGALFGALLSAGLASFGASDWRPFASLGAPHTIAPKTATPAPILPSRAPIPAEAAAPRDAAIERDAIPVRDLGTLALPQDVVQALVQVWLATSLAWLALTLWRGLGLWRLRQRLRHAPPASAAQRDHAEAVAAALTLAAPQLRRVATLSSPIALPGGWVLLPHWCDALPPEETRALLAHEFAHLKRRDPWWRIAQHLILAPLSLHPLAWVAQRRLHALAERQADAMAAQLLGDGRPLAQCLARCLAQHTPPSSPRLALAMAERPGAVVDRVQQLLEEDPMDYQPPSPRKTRLVLALGLVAALALPALAVTALDGGQSHSISIHSDDDGDSIAVTAREKGYALDLEMAGKVEFSADDSDVQSMAADAELSIEETRDGVTRSIEFRPQGQGIERDYRVEGEARAFDAEARAWLAKALPEIFRNTGIDATRRAQRILQRSGVPGLLAEIELIRGDYSRARYLSLLFSSATLDAAQLTQALALTRAIESDFEMRQTLSAALPSQRLAPTQQAQVLDVAQALGSDFERAELLVQSAARFAFDDATSAAWKRVLAGLGSDFERRRVLEALLARDTDAAVATRLALEAAQRIGSDFERRQVLEASLARLQGDAELLRTYLALTDEIGSDFERRQALIPLIQTQTLDVPLALATLETLEGMGSDFERKEVLVALAQTMPADAAVIERFRASARALGSFERGQVEEALDRRTVFK